ncbi:MAG: RNA 2',3'-cyclic phosphodiesterase [Thermoplasmata archaeon]|nr:RNA 2',3'-cyclic phosphodiesterase [Thermoplasmata archaeon]
MSFRAFISADLDPNPLIENFSKALQNTGARLKAVRMEQIHMTLKFLGPTEEKLVPKIEGLMKEAVTGVKPFEIGFKGTGAFPNMNYIKVVWVGLVNSGPLAEVSRFLNDEMASLGFKREGRGFSPHVTIGRLKGSKGKEMIQEILSKTKTADFGVQTIDRLKLKKSVLEASGPVYSTIAEVPFPTD